MPVSLVATGITKSFGRAAVLDDVSVTVGPGDRIGVVAPNGTGKTTLLRIVAGELAPDRGTVMRMPPAATVGYLPQEPERSPDETLRAFLSRRTGVAAAEHELEHASHALAGAGPDADERYAHALERYLSLGGPDLAARVGTVCADLGLPDDVLGLPTSALSGGQAARASLAAILLARFDIFLLDEPTNDLDFDGLARLEAFVSGMPGGVLIVSHDRSFLARTITSVLELDPRSRRATPYAGGWDAYLELRTTARRHAEEAYEEFEGKRRELAERAREQRQWAVQGVRKATKRPRDNDKAQRDFRINRTEKQAAKVRITEKALDRLDAVDKPYEPWRLQLRFVRARRSGDVVAVLDGVVIERGDFRLGPVDLEIAWGERIALTGPNGSGKTTLLAAILGRLPLASGTRRLGPGVVVGELGQSRQRFDTAPSLLAGFLAETGMTLSDGRTLLAKFGLGADDVDRRTTSLSPGERTRAELALFMARGVNLLVLDEPTNHLDLPAIEQLEVALEAYDGTLLLVTHDRALLDAVETTRAIVLGADMAT
jgi:ATPase subunit of ABC transporter with duplicated ATPase domains